MEDTKILADEYRRARAAREEARERYERAEKTFDTAKCLLAHHMVVLVETGCEWAQNERVGTTREGAQHAVAQLNDAREASYQAMKTWDELSKHVFDLSQAVVESVRAK
jgi:hypothetical protein